MKTITRIDGSVRIEYEARQYPGLFEPFRQNAARRMPTEEVQQWLRDHNQCYWNVVNYSFMSIYFQQPDTAALFKLTFA